jgi:CheY-like chemotaxis protein
MKKLNCILLIDDNLDDNFFHSLIIKEAGAAEIIKTAVNGEKALEYLEKSKGDPIQYPFPDLIFLDINMPRINGFEFLEKAREKKYFENVKPVVVVMLTSSLNPTDEKRAKEDFSDEIVDFENKPLSAKMLDEIVDKFFD